MIEPPPTEFWLRLPYHRPPLSLNVDMHWAARRMFRDGLNDSTRWLAIAAKVPKGATRVRLTLVYNAPDRGRRDEDNMMPTLKPCADALVKYGLIPDDSSEYVESRCAIGEIRKPGQVWLKIEVTA